MPGLLFLHGGAEEARRVFREEERGCWSAALPLVLEKHGCLDLVEVSDDELGASLQSEDVACVLVARLTAERAESGVISRLLESERPLLIDGPVPSELHGRLGITAASPLIKEGSVGIASKWLANAARAYGYPAGGRVGPPIVREVDRHDRTDWDRLDVPITAAQAKAWRSLSWDAEAWSVSPDTEVLATWTPPGGKPSPAIIRRGALTATAFSLFAILGQAHTSEPWNHGEYRSSLRSTGLETLLLALVDDLHRQAGIVRARVLPWPRGARWVLNVRHDFDRFLGPAPVAEALRRHQEAGTAATWYWRARHLRLGLRARRWSGNLALRLVEESDRHEVALHTEQMWDVAADRERRAIERVAGHRVLGSCAHGDPACFRFQGAPNLLWAEREGLRYTELIQHSHHHPHRFAALRDDGLIEPLRLVAMPHHESLDKSASGGDAEVARILRAAEQFARTGGLLQAMNHPDINQDELFEALRGISRAGRLDWTAARAADWWQRTHVRDALEVVARSATDFRIRSGSAIEGLVIELLHPSGERRLRLVNLDAGGSTTVDLSLEAQGK